MFIPFQIPARPKSLLPPNDPAQHARSNRQDLLERVPPAHLGPLHSHTRLAVAHARLQTRLQPIPKERHERSAATRAPKRPSNTQRAPQAHFIRGLDDSNPIRIRVRQHVDSAPQSIRGLLFANDERVRFAIERRRNIKELFFFVVVRSQVGNQLANRRNKRAQQMHLPGHQRPLFVAHQINSNPQIGQLAEQLVRAREPQQNARVLRKPARSTVLSSEAHHRLVLPQQLVHENELGVHIEQPEPIVHARSDSDRRDREE